MLFLFFVFVFFKEVHQDNEGGKPSQSDIKQSKPKWRQHITCTLLGHLLSWLCVVSRRAVRPQPSLTRPAHKEGIHLQGAPTGYTFGSSTPSVWKLQRTFICWIPYQMISTKTAKLFTTVCNSQNMNGQRVFFFKDVSWYYNLSVGWSTASTKCLVFRMPERGLVGHANKSDSMFSAMIVLYQ